MTLALLAICVGAVITAQAGLNASLGKQLGNPLFGATVAFGVSLGFSALAALTLTGQLLLALIAGHFGWFQLPVNPLSPTKVIGAATLILGITLIHRG